MKDKVAHVCIHNNSSHESDFTVKSNTRDCFTTFPNRKKKKSWKHDPLCVWKCGQTNMLLFSVGLCQLNWTKAMIVSFLAGFFIMADK